jgi:pilus assembly protein Flp/PilA
VLAAQFRQRELHLNPHRDNWADQINQRRLSMCFLNELFDRKSLLSNLLRDEAGATAIEYGLIAALIAVAAIAAMGLVGTSLTNTFNTVASKL